MQIAGTFITRIVASYNYGQGKRIGKSERDDRSSIFFLLFFPARVDAYIYATWAKISKRTFGNFNHTSNWRGSFRSPRSRQYTRLGPFALRCCEKGRNGSYRSRSPRHATSARSPAIIIYLEITYIKMSSERADQKGRNATPEN